MPDKRRFLERAKDNYDEVTEKLSEVRDKTRERIEEKPFTSVIIAAAIGAVAGAATAEIIRMIRRSGKK